MATTLLDLRNLTYDIAGDRRARDGSPTIASTTVANLAVNESIKHHVFDAEGMSYYPLWAVADIPIAKSDYPSQQIDLTGSPTGGTFTSTLFGRTTAAIAYNAAASAVQTALRAVRFAQGVLTVTGATPTWTAVWSGSTPADRSKIPLMTASGAGLTGGTNPTATITASDSGSTYDREYSLDQYLQDSAYRPNYRSRIDLRMVSGDDEFPLLAVPNADFRLKDSLSVLPFGRNFPSEFVYDYKIGDTEIGGHYIGGPSGTGLYYLRGAFLGFADVPGSDYTVRARYVPTVTPLASDTDTLDDVGLSFLSDFGTLIASYAAMRLRSDRNVGSAVGNQYALCLEEFRNAVWQRMTPVLSGGASRWRV